MPLRQPEVPRHHAGAEEEVSTGGLPAVEVARVAETGSTNADLLAWARSAPAGVALVPRALVAERQTAGRGRLGRTWAATPGASLTFSLAWPLAAGIDLSGLSLAVGVALAGTLDPKPAEALRIGLKWPNDLWLVGTGEPGRKLGGVLIETVPRGIGRVAVIGIGLNLLEQRVAGASSGVAWLAEIDAAAAASAATLPDRLLSDLAVALHRFEREGFPAFAAAFAERDLLRGRTVRSAAGNGPGPGPGHEGIAAGVSASGELLLRTPTGLERIGSGEVSMRIAGGASTALDPQPAARTSW
ncbi:MAG: biotin--[acetyl-CoA-carboxylase] ligase [Burkholderiales bacterium]|nr:biotin--[acetyl-CoA-carboxylase] ligase [Burkholderiales bacterium]